MKDTNINVRHSNRTECGNSKSISLVAPAGNVLLKDIAGNLLSVDSERRSARFLPQHWVIAAKSAGEWQMGVKKVAEELEEPWRYQHERANPTYILGNKPEAVALRVAERGTATADMITATAHEKSNTDIVERVARPDLHPNGLWGEEGG